ncbi:DUF1573 domain-containing protein [Crocinitomicaceae bacterium]|nr:DUF1573 domain-containing protein [Crocinitomicaceae bacterium]MDG2464925.1 DUF1573 domain-containing protein [Crocinitomicaceae bacterium]
MKKVLMILSFLFSIGMTSSLNAQAEKGAKIEFVKLTHDYGNIKQGANGLCTFQFTNTGNEDLIIVEAKKSCGCTVPSWPKEPIPPGGKGVIEVRYDTNRTGGIAKNVTIISNAINAQTQVLRIKGNIAAAGVDDEKVKTENPTY